MKLVRLAPAALVFLCACRPDYKFHDIVLYEAPRGQFQVLVEARGTVRGGHDVSQESNSRVTFSPSGPPTLALEPDVFTIEVAQREGRLHFGHEFVPDDAGRDVYAEVLARILTRYRYRPNPDELQELVLIIEGALAGPKGTHVEGQTKAFRVVSSHFE